MSDMISRNVDELPASSREVIEGLLGAQLKPHQRVYIVIDVPPTGPAEPIRMQAAKRIAEIISQAQAHADRQGVPEQEIDAAVDEAMNFIRPQPKS